MEHRLTDAGAVVRFDGLAEAPQFPAAPLEIPANHEVTLLLDHRVLQTAYPELTVSGGKSARITMTYSEALYGERQEKFTHNEEKGNRNEIAGKTIEESRMNLNWRAGIIVLIRRFGGGRGVTCRSM